MIIIAANVATQPPHRHAERRSTAGGDDHVELHNHGVDQLLLFSVLDSEIEEENRPDPGSELTP